jgi:1-acyl-sn-glycerol-3-phosphate acyltransferase
MFIHIIRGFSRLVLWIFFRRIDVKGRELVPPEGQLVFVANHPNVMADILLLGVYVPRNKPRFIGKSTLFKSPLFGWFLRRMGTIPVSRPQDTGVRMSSNRMMLAEAVNTLKKGRSLILFPEGLSHAQIRVRTLKLGAAHIALSAAAADDGCPDLRIVPVGLTFMNPAVFRSDAAMHFGKPIEVRRYLQTFLGDHHAAERELTAVIHERVAALTRHVENPDLESIIRDLSAIYADRAAREVADSAELSRRLRTEQEIIRAADLFSRTEPELVQGLALQLRKHHRKLKILHLEPHAIVLTRSERPGLSHLILTALLSPLAVYGFIFNAVPYYLPRFFVPSYRARPETIATVKLFAGISIFILYYLLMVTVAYLLSGLSTALVFGAALPVSGLFTLFHHERFLQRWPLWQTMIVPRRRRYFLRRLSRERAVLIRDLDKLKERYLTDLEQKEKGGQV